MLDNFVLPLPTPRTPAERRAGRAGGARGAGEAADAVARQRRNRAGAPAVRLLDLGFGMVSSFNGRGTVPEDHPLNLGGLTGNGMPMIQEFYKSVDLMLVVGCRLRGHETGDFSVKLPDNIIQIDSDPARQRPHLPQQLLRLRRCGGDAGGAGRRAGGQAEAAARLPG